MTEIMRKTLIFFFLSCTLAEKSILDCIELKGGLKFDHLLPVGYIDNPFKCDDSSQLQMKLIAKKDCKVQRSRVPIETIIEESYLANPSNASQRLNITFTNYTATVPLQARFLTESIATDKTIENLVRFSIRKAQQFRRS